MNFKKLSDADLLDYVKTLVQDEIELLSDSDLLELKYELTIAKREQRFPVPLIIIIEIQKRNIQAPEQPELYGEYGYDN